MLEMRGRAGVGGAAPGRKAALAGSARSGNGLKFVEVNEAGTEAAAATLFEAKSKSMMGRFNADHPFLFLIRDLDSGTILFPGRLSDPSS